jgi:hypothetical protein
MPHELSKVLDGSLGYFWVQNSIDQVGVFSDEPISGMLQLVGDDGLELAGLIADPSGTFFSARTEGSPNPSYIVGSTDNGGILLSGTSEIRSSANIGGSKASTVHYRCESLVIDVDLRSVQNGLVESVSARWGGIGRWAGARTVLEQPHRGADGRLHGLDIKLSRLPPLSITIDSDDTELELGSTWLVSGPSDSRLVSAPLEFTVTPAEPCRIEEAVETLIRLQDLLNLAFQGFVAAAGGAVILHDPLSGDMSKKDLWVSRLMRVPGGARPPKSMTELPLFFMSDIGGIEGVSRWLRLCREHPRLIRPIVTPYQIGRSYAEALLVDLGTAIDYWRGANKGVEDWAKEKFQPLAVGASIGSSFNEWVGDSEKWADHFWYHYNGLKHYIPDYRFNDEAVHWLALSGMVLVTCAAVQEVAAEQGNPSARALNGHRWANRGSAVRDWLETVPRDPKK